MAKETTTAPKKDAAPKADAAPKKAGRSEEACCGQDPQRRARTASTSR